MKSAVFDLGYAGCVSCKRAIEHAGRRIKGIEDINVDIATHSINLRYDESFDDVKDKVKEVVSMIGYEAKLVSDQ